MSKTYRKSGRKIEKNKFLKMAVKRNQEKYLCIVCVVVVMVYNWDHVSYGGPRGVGRYLVEYTPMYRPILLSDDILGGSPILHRYFTDTSPMIHRYFTDTSPSVLVDIGRYIG